MTSASPPVSTEQQLKDAFSSLAREYRRRGLDSHADAVVHRRREVLRWITHGSWDEAEQEQELRALEGKLEPYRVHEQRSVARGDSARYFPRVRSGRQIPAVLDPLGSQGAERGAV